MLESLRRLGGIHLSRWRFRRMRNDIISFSGSMSTGGHALLILPLTPTVQSPAPVIELLRTRFPEERLTVVTDEQDSGAGVLLPRSTIIRMPPSHIDWFYRPSRQVMEQVAARSYSIAIDLNLDSLLPSAYICKGSNARVRVGCSREGAEYFYNFVMQPDASRGGALYDRLAGCLKMF